MRHFLCCSMAWAILAAVVGFAGIALGNPVGPLPDSLIPVPRRLSQPVAEALQAVREAMARRDLLQAASILEEARQTYREPDDAIEIESMWLRYRFLLRFWSAVRAGRGDLQPGSQLVLNGVKLRVVRVDRSQIFVQGPESADRGITLVRARMEPALAEALARTHLTKLGGVRAQLLAAFHLLDAHGDQEQARALCEELYARGLNVEVWLPEL